MRIRIYHTIGMLVMFISVCAGTSKDSTAIMYASTITVEDLKKHLEVLASDEYGGRDAGSAGQKMAAEYIKDHFVRIGIPPISEQNALGPLREGYFQEFKLKTTDPSVSQLVVGDRQYSFGDEFFFLDAPAGDRPNIEEIVFCGYAGSSEELNEMDAIDIDGTFALFIDDQPKNKKGEVLVDDGNYPSSFFTRMQERQELFEGKGVKGVFVVLRDMEAKAKAFSMFLKGGRTTLYDGESDELPMIFISEEVANDILHTNGSSLKKIEKRIIKSMTPQNFVMSTNVRLALGDGVRTETSENVLGFIEGSDLKDELVVITAHFDHVGQDEKDIYNGADDDGSGTVALLELAEAFMKAKEEGNGPRRSVLFMPVSAEEKGLLGSKYYTDHPIFPMENTIVDLNIDMIGRFDEEHGEDAEYVYLIGSDRLSTELHRISEEANDNYTKIDLDYTFNDPEDPNKFYYRSDHYNFAKNNIPVIFYFSGVHEDYHKPTDTVDKIRFDKLQKRSELIFHTAWVLANRDKRIQVDIVPDQE